ncbi:MAG: hypothetical protein FJY65_12710, partial [Calditrichaeota bacterium]|nr:hypothetical protein [Calditrichota bacterium]
MFRYSVIGLVIMIGAVMAQEQTDSASAVEEIARQAEETVKDGFKVIWDYRVLNDMADASRDTNKTGVIGLAWTPLTT